MNMPPALLADHVMIDLETMGTGPDAAIVAIGAVAFDPATERITATHYQLVDLQSAVDLGGQMTCSSVLWWLQQSDAARAELARPGEPLRMALQCLGEWLRRATVEGVQVWGNGCDFDNVILASAYRRAGMPLPWRWSRNRCYRTVRALHPDVLLARGGVHHNALDDAAHQAQHLMLALGRPGQHRDAP
jgi:hypothetical protein